MNCNQLTFAREYRGFTQGDLAGSIEGLSQSTLSKFEKGIGSLSEKNQNDLIKHLGFPKAFFEKKLRLEIDNANYRRRTTLSKSNIKDFENKCRIIAFTVDEFSETIEWPEFKFPALDVDDGYSPKDIAKYVRKSLGLSGNESVRDIITLLESNGVIVYELEANEKIDGLSFVTEKGMAVIVINKDMSNDRKRFTLAHELGHLIMHADSCSLISSHRSKENEANEFASEFLMPEEAIKDSLRNLKLPSLGPLKEYWLTSMSAIIKRAYDLRCIDDNKRTYFMIEMSRMGYGKREPYPVYIDSPTSIKRAIDIFTKQLAYTSKELAESISLPEDVFSDLFLPGKVIKFKLSEFANYPTN